MSDPLVYLVVGTVDADPQQYAEENPQITANNAIFDYLTTGHDLVTYVFRNKTVVDRIIENIKKAADEVYP